MPWESERKTTALTLAAAGICSAEKGKGQHEMGRSRPERLMALTEGEQLLDFTGELPTHS